MVYGIKLNLALATPLEKWICSFSIFGHVIFSENWFWLLHYTSIVWPTLWQRLLFFFHQGLSSSFIFITYMKFRHTLLTLPTLTKKGSTYNRLILSILWPVSMLYAPRIFDNFEISYVHQESCVWNNCYGKLCKIHWIKQELVFLLQNIAVYWSRESDPPSSHNNNPRPTFFNPSPILEK